MAEAQSWKAGSPLLLAPHLLSLAGWGPYTRQWLCCPALPSS